MRSSALVSATSSGSLAACESDDGPVPPPATSRATPCQRERPLPAPGGAPRAWGGAHREAGRGAAAAASSVWPVPSASGAGCARGAAESTRRPPAVPSVWACGRRAGRPWCLDGPAAMAGAGRPRPGAPGRRRSAPRGRAPGPPGTRVQAPRQGGEDDGAEVRWRAWGRPVLRAPRAGRRRCGCGAREAWGPQGGQRGRVAWR